MCCAGSVLIQIETWKLKSCRTSDIRRTNADRNIRLYYPYRQYTLHHTILFIYRLVNISWYFPTWNDILFAGDKEGHAQWRSWRSYYNKFPENIYFCLLLFSLFEISPFLKSCAFRRAQVIVHTYYADILVQCYSIFRVFHVPDSEKPKSCL